MSIAITTRQNEILSIENIVVKVTSSIEKNDSTSIMASIQRVEGFALLFKRKLDREYEKISTKNKVNPLCDLNTQEIPQPTNKNVASLKEPKMRKGHQCQI